MSRVFVHGLLLLGALGGVLRFVPESIVEPRSELAAGAFASEGAVSSTGPRMPRSYVDVSYPATTGQTLWVDASGDLQATLDSARPGDVIELEAGAVFQGPFRLPRKGEQGWIVVRTSREAGLPRPGKRVKPAHAALMAALQSSHGSVLSAESGAHHYRFVGVEFRPAPGAELVNLVELGGPDTAPDDPPHHIVLDRCILRGDPARGARRGVALNGRHLAVVDSHLQDFKRTDGDSQAIAGWEGLGPFAIVNNRLEGAGENLMFGGGDPRAEGVAPSDIEVRLNHFVKPLSWKPGERGFQGSAWVVKNLFELKNARRVLVEGNLFEHNWVGGQNGFAILFTVRNQDGTAPWSVVEDVTFRNNVVRHAAAGINLLGRDALPSGRTSRVLVRNNLFEDLGGERWGGGAGALAMLLEGTAHVVFDHNTAIHTGPILVAEGQPHEAFVFRNNVVAHNAYGIVGTGTAPGVHTLDTYFPGAQVLRNVIAGGAPERYPGENFFPASLEEVGFVSLAAGDYRLRPDSPLGGAATDGHDVGVVFDELLAVLGESAAQHRLLAPRVHQLRSSRR